MCAGTNEFQPDQAEKIIIFLYLNGKFTPQATKGGF